MKAFSAILTILFLFACQSPDLSHFETRADGTTAFTGNAMTMQYKILVGQTLSPTQNTKILEIIKSTFNDTNSIFNKWNPGSELSKLNSLKTEIAIPLSADLLRLFIETDAIVKLSQGLFDPTIEPLQELWKRKLDAGRVPTDEEIQDIAPALGWDKISFRDGIFTKEHDMTKLDFGGIAKGLCIDMMVERINAAGFPNLYVE
ncbi:MAG TPA: FAD:protein FMN transferase, partial [Parachlamydiaceae bacterium]|nr:FAD:protein FMN transferase [Parachlamydiaceae bacterium]